MKKRILAALLILCIILSFMACKKKDSTDEMTPEQKAMEEKQAYANLPDQLECTMLISKYGEVKIELYKDVAPQAVLNFIYLANSGFYDGLIFHKVDKGVLVQTGKYETGHIKREPVFEYGIKGEFTSNGYNNPITFQEGTIGMMRSFNGDNAANSASTEFFITIDRETALNFDGEYTAFGRVVEGMDIIKKINKVKTTGTTPNKDISIVQLYVTIPEECKGKLALPEFLGKDGKVIENAEELIEKAKKEKAESNKTESEKSGN